MEDRRSQDRRPQEAPANYDRRSQERYNPENRKYDIPEYPQSILKRRDLDYERDPKFANNDYRRAYDSHSHPRTYSRSPPREDWRSRDSESPNRYGEKSPVSPLRGNDENIHKMSPGCRVPFMQIEDPVERRSLISQLDDLKHRLHYDYTKDNNEINELRRDKENEIQDILRK